MKTVPFFVFLLTVYILALFPSILPSRCEIETIAHSRTDRWKMLSGELQDADQAERFLYKVLEQSEATALSVAVISGHRVVLQREMGIIDEDSGKSVDEKTVFRSASLSKPIFAYLVMKLIDEGLIEVDRPVYKYLEQPLYKYSEYQDLKDDNRYQLLTARLILSHQSGFPNWVGRLAGEDSNALLAMLYFMSALKRAVITMPSYS